MRSNPTNRLLKAFANAWLLFLIHYDAFRLAPAAYLTATKWWILRKRVRARGQFAPLLGHSHRAYMLWGLRDGWAKENSPHGQLPPIVALVDTATSRHTGPEALNATLSSLDAEGVPVFLIGENHQADIASAVASIDWDAEPWLMPVAAGDLFVPGAAAAYRSAIAASTASVIFADDDQLDRWGHHMAPHFKPDWNDELFRHFDYLTGACIIRTDPTILQSIEETPHWAHQLVSQSASGGSVRHLHRVLHHRQVRIAPPVAARPLRLAAELPPVTIIVPTRNRVDLLRTCLDGVAATNYPDIEVIVVDNDSDDLETLSYLEALDPKRTRVIRHPGQFNYSTINNRAAGDARGRLLCLLNNDIEVMAPDWLAIMATQALRDGVGAVGAQLLYPDGRIQHAGVVVGVGNAAGHAHRFVDPGEEGYFRRHALPQFTSAVTGACLVVARERFMAVGGLDERNFAVAYNDVDLCLRLNQRGWQSLYEPRALLTHHESVSRGDDRDPLGAARFAGELAALKRIWKTDEIIDPFHHPHLSRAAERFTLAI